MNYQAVAINALPGLDAPADIEHSLVRFRPNDRTTIVVPVLADPWDDQVEYVNVVLTSPSGGRAWGRPAAH